jgi:SAM-dependent methyltransferase
MKKLLTAKLTRKNLDRFIADRATTARTLDIGGADSPYARYFPNRVCLDVIQYEGVDVIGDAHDLPFEDGSFECILCTEVLEHLHTPEKAINEMRRVLKPGGTLILTTRFIFPIHDAPGDYFRYTKYGLRHLLREWDIRVVQEEALTMDTFSVLIQRIAFQTDMRGGRFTKACFLLLARCVRAAQFLIKKEYGMRSKRGVVEEKAIMASGYYVEAVRKI